MATANSTEPVWAVGDSGQHELTPSREVVCIPALPVGPSNTCIPASIRATFHKSQGIPTKLTRLERVDIRGNAAVRVSYDCTPFALGELDNVTPLGWHCKVHLFNEDHARDPLFDRLNELERARIARAASRLRT